MNKPDVETAKKDADFGKQLREARKAQNYTVEEISEHIKVPVQTLKVIEASDLDKLPVPTFAQGYIRAYAKFLEISEDSVLEKYNLAVPHQEEATLRPRSKLPGEASSQSPLVKSITMLLMLAGIAAVIFGSFKYYQEKAGAMEEELDNRDQSLIGNSLDSPGSNRLSIERDAGLADDGEMLEEQADPYEAVPAAGADQDILVDAADSEIEAVAEEVVIEQPPENDIIEFFAENGSWMEVRDVNKSRLFYNMIPVGGSKVIVGKAPFNVTMGNAKTTRVVINDLEVDMTDHIRPNNTAVFNVSTNGQDIIIH